MKFYSDSTKGFYDERSDLPDDAIEITDEEYQAVLDEQSSGREIVRGANGKPETRERPVPPGQERRNRDALVRKHLDDTAQGQGFESMLDAVSYANEPTDPARQVLGASLRSWRSTVMLRVDAAPANQPAPALIASLPDFSV